MAFPYSFLRSLLDGSPAWASTAEPVSYPERWACERERERGEEAESCKSAPYIYPVRDVQLEAYKARYENGRRKRDRFPRVDLTRRQVLIVIHQTGFEWSEANPRIPMISAHRVVGPKGTRFSLHPLDVRLVAANRLDRAPYHAISIEVIGNFEGEDGSGRWYMPDRFGRGRASEAQIIATRQEVTSVIEGVELLGGQVVGCVPHRVSGVSSKTRKPNRPICCGSRLHANVVEWSGAVHGLDVPGPGWSIGGLPIPDSWHGPHWPACRDRIGSTVSLAA